MEDKAEYYSGDNVPAEEAFFLGFRTRRAKSGVSGSLRQSAPGAPNKRSYDKRRLLSDNGPSYIASDLAKYLAAQDIKHTRGRPYHPQTQGKIKRWHRSLKNQILLENYYLPGELAARISRFVDSYNNERHHESLNNLTPADVYYGRGHSILARREQIKLNTMAMRCKTHERNRVESFTLMS